MRPREVQTRETLRFVLESLPAGPDSPTAARLRILEVGCGGGELAKELQGRGHEVVAVDSSAERVEEARRRGVDARLASFPDFDGAEFDAVLFTRSLHHIRPLAPAVARAHELLKSAGRLVVEDFAFGETSGETAAWFYRLLRLLEACGALTAAADSFGRRLLDGGGDFALWREHADEINSARDVADALGERFEILEARPAPYLYRYVADMVADTDAGGEAVARVLALEEATGRLNAGHLIGRRLVAAPKLRS